MKPPSIALLLILVQQVLACIDVLFVIDNKTLEVSRNRAIQIAKTLPEDQKIRKWVVLSRNDRYVPRVVRNNAELQQVLSTIHGDYDRFLEIATGEIARRTATFQPFVILLFSETPVNQTMSNMWRSISLAPALHIYRIGSLQRTSRMLSEDQETDFENLILCGRNRTSLFDTASSKFHGGNEIRRSPTSTSRPLTSTRNPFVRRLTFYDASRTLIEKKEDNLKQEKSKEPQKAFTITRTFKKMTTTTTRPTTTTTVYRKPTASKFDAKKSTSARKTPFQSTSMRPFTSTTPYGSTRKSSTIQTSTRQTTAKGIQAPVTTRHIFTTSSTRHPSTTTTPKKIKINSSSKKSETSQPTQKTTTTYWTSTRNLVTTTPRIPTTTRTTRIPWWLTSTTTSSTHSRTTSHSDSTFWHPTEKFETTPSPAPPSTIEAPIKKLPEPIDFMVRSRNVHFTMTERPPPPMNPMMFFSTTRLPSTTTKVQIPLGCTADVFFLVDLSQGTGDKSQQYFDIAASAISTLPISQDAVRVGLISYSGPGRTHVRVYLDKHSEKEKLIEEMFTMERHGGTTRTADAIRYAVKIFEGKAHPARKNVKKVLVVFTDGYSQDNPKEAARSARSRGIQLMAVAVKDRLAPPDQTQLEDIGGSSMNVFISPSGRELRDKIIGAQCRM